MSLETLSHISGILGFLAVIFTVFLRIKKEAIVRWNKVILNREIGVVDSTCSEDK